MSNETKRWYVKAPDWMSNETQGWLYKFAGCSIHTISGDKRKFTPDEQFTTEEIKKYHLAGFETVEVPDEQRSELNDELYEGLFSQYDAAFPDNLPVIPKVVGEYIRKAKAPGKWGLLDVFWHLGDNISAVGINGLYDWQRWMADNQVAVARAWLLGVWRVEETGEIVKLEEEK